MVLDDDLLHKIKSIGSEEGGYAISCPLCRKKTKGEISHYYLLGCPTQEGEIEV